jgi:hypothetical protein
MARVTASGRFDLDRTFEATYFGLRWGLVALAAAFPLLLWWGGAKFYGIPLQNSMSAYYLTGMRDWFVGILFAVAACLYLYKGLSERENYLLNTAGLFAVGIAVNPLNWQPEWLPKGWRPHDIFAVSFFVMIALSCWLCQDDSLALGLVPPHRVARYRFKYAATGVALVALPAVAVLINSGVFARGFETSIFWVEAVAIWVFGFYWYTKSGELRQASRKSMNLGAHA